MAHDDLEDIEACVRGERMPRVNGPYLVKISGPEKDSFEGHRIEDPMPDGRQIIRMVGARPVEEHLVFMVLKGGGLEELRLDETADLRSRGIEKFIVFHSAASFRFVVESERFEWGTKLITGLKIAELAGIDLETYELWKVRRAEAGDEKIAPDAIIDLSDPGLERFYKCERVPATIIVHVNGRRKEVDPTRICFEDLIVLAFDTPPQGEQICFTVTYRKGPAEQPEGSLIEGQCVKLVKGMVFNVTATDKS